MSGNGYGTCSWWCYIDKYGMEHHDHQASSTVPIIVHQSTGEEPEESDA